MKKLLIGFMIIFALNISTTAYAEEVGIRDTVLELSETAIVENTDGEVTDQIEANKQNNETELEDVNQALNEDVEAEQELDLFTVDLPCLNETSRSFLDYILDPMDLITITDSARYGEQTFYTGSRFYFRNTQGDWDYSNKSDPIIVTNNGNQPLLLTVSVVVDNTSQVKVSNDANFLSNECAIYLSLYDNMEQELSVGEDGEVSYSVTLNPSVTNSEEDLTTVNQYVFGLEGLCSSLGDWSKVDILPSISLIWDVSSLESNALEELDISAVEDSAISDDDESVDTISEKESQVTDEESDENNDSVNEFVDSDGAEDIDDNNDMIMQDETDINEIKDINPDNEDESICTEMEKDLSEQQSFSLSTDLLSPD